MALFQVVGAWLAFLLIVSAESALPYWRRKQQQGRFARNRLINNFNLRSRTQQQQRNTNAYAEYLDNYYSDAADDATYDINAEYEDQAAADEAYAFDEAKLSDLAELLTYFDLDLNELQFDEEESGEKVEASGGDEAFRNYVNAPGFLVKMNPEVFFAYVRLLSAIYTPKDKKTAFPASGIKSKTEAESKWSNFISGTKWNDGKKESEAFRKALKNEAYILTGRARKGVSEWVKAKALENKWSILSTGAGYVPVVGSALKVAVTAMKYAPTAYGHAEQKLLGMYQKRQAKKQLGYGSVGHKKLVEDDELFPDHSLEPFALYVMEKAWPFETCPLKTGGDW